MMLESAFRRSGDRFVGMRVTTRTERRRPDAMGSDTALGAAHLRPATPASQGGAQAPAKGAPGIARDRYDPSRLRFAAHLRLRPRLKTEAWTRARRPARSNSFFGKNTFPPAALNPGPEDGWPIGRLGTHRTQTPRGTRDAAKPPDGYVRLCRFPGVPRRGRFLITGSRPSVLASRSLHRHRPRI
jgi:hypothetical protein